MFCCFSVFLNFGNIQILSIMIRSLFSLAILCLVATTIYAQYDLNANRVWVFGNKSGMQFNGPSPTPLSSQITTGEGCASVCDDNGTLRFYTNGNKVWTASGALMPHGQSLDIPTSQALTTTQPALIVQSPAAANIYYLFTLGIRLFCYRVDMSMNGGAGDIDTAFALTHLQLRDSLAEKLIAIPGCDHNIWVLVKSTHSGQFFAYNVTAQGVSTVPVVSEAGYSEPPTYYQGYMCASPDGHKIAVTSTSHLELLNFDITTGKVSNGRVIDSQAFYYGVCFSPSGRYLYCNAHTIYQFDLQSCDPAASRTGLGPSFLSDIRLAPNGKIYFRASPISLTHNFLGSIELPDLGGTACHYRDSVSGTGMPVLDPNSSGTYSLGLGNTVVYPGSPEKSINRLYLDTCICRFPFSTGFALQSEAGFQNYQWNTGATGAVLNVQEPGTYYVRYQTVCGMRNDTFRIRSLANAISLTFNDPVLTASGGFQSYKWYKDGALIAGVTGATYTPLVSGMYSVTGANAQGCTDSAFLQVTIASTGIQELLQNGRFRVYPNPASDAVFIEGDHSRDAVLTDISGRRILHAGNADKIDIHALQPGFYYLKIYDPSGALIRTVKIVKVPAR